jgi:spore coat polysaccharide biosynthesis protein SpsF
VKRKVVAIIQARMGSTRLPGKVLKSILGKEMLWYLVSRVKNAKLIDQIVIATTTNLEDKKIIEFCKREKIDYFQGHETDVLDRYYQAAKKFKATEVVRITGDCPLADSRVIDGAIEKFFSGEFDHLGVATGAGVAGKDIFKFPDGLDCEIFKFEVLEKGALLSKNPLEREHVTMYTWTRPEVFKLGNLFSERDYSDYRFTVDHPKDLELMRAIFRSLYKNNSNFSLDDVIKLIENNPKLLEINNQHLGDEGYEDFIKEKLHKEFENVPITFNPEEIPDALVVLSAEENDISGENKERINEAVKISKRFKRKLIFLGTKTHNLNFEKYIRTEGLDFTTPVKRQGANTKTQISELAKYLITNKFSNLLIISSSYHIPRIRRYVSRYLDKNTAVSFLGVGKINTQKLQIELEIEKIIKYAEKGDLVLLPG